MELEIISVLRNLLPLMFSRKDIERLIPGVISAKTLANLSSVGEGPIEHRIGKRKICYDRESFLQWLEPRISKCIDMNIKGGH